MGLVAGVIGLIFRLNDMHLNDIPAAFNQGAADITGIPATPCATARPNVFCQELPKPIWVAT